MGSLRSCLSKAGDIILPEDRDALIALRREILDDGIGASESGEQAVTEFMEQLQAERLELLGRINQAGGDIVPATPQPQIKTDNIEEAPTPLYSRTAPDKLGFYSGLARAAQSLKQAKGTPEQMLGIMRNFGGVKDEELEWTGLAEFLEIKGDSVTKAEIEEFLAGGGVQVNEVTLPGEVEPLTESENDELIDLQNKDINDMSPDDSDRRMELTARKNNELGEGAAKFRNYTMPGGENYREVLLQLPTTGLEPASQTAIYSLNKSLARKSLSPLDEEQIAVLSRPTNEAFEMLDDFEARLGVDVSDARADMAAVGTGNAASKMFFGTHFDQPNIIAHLRLNDRTGPNGEKILFIEEVQSDWHQKGRKIGYKRLTGKLPASWRVEKAADGWQVRAPDDTLKLSKAKTEEEAISVAIEIADIQKTDQGFGVIPDAPFKGNAWIELAMKRVLRMAAEGGYAQVAWTSGEQQIDRYDLSKQLDRIEYEPNGKNYEVKAVGLDGTIIFDRKAVKPDELQGIVGKDIAKRIIDGEGVWAAVRNRMVLKEDNLKVGGEGMKSFYNRTMPNVMRKIARKLDKGSKVGPTKIEAGGFDVSYFSSQHVISKKWLVRESGSDKVIGPEYDTESEALAAAHNLGKERPAIQKTEEVWGIAITAGMKNQVLEKGQSLFSRGEEPKLGPAVKAAQLRVALAPAIRSLVGKVQVEIVETTADLPKYTKFSDVEGVWYGSRTEGQTPTQREMDTVYLVAESLHDVIRAKRVMAHETFGHLAMEEQPEFDEVMAAIRNLKNMGNAAVVKAAAQVAATQDKLDSITETKEILAVMVENGVQSGTINRAIAGARQMLRRLGFTLDFTEGEIRELVVRAARTLHRGAAAKRAALSNMPAAAQLLEDPRTVEHAVYAAINEIYANATLQDMTLSLHAELSAISDSTDPAQTARASELRQVLYRSKIAPVGTPDMMDPEALYSIAYHGTHANFESFDIKFMGTGEGFQAFGWGLYFSSSKEVAEWYRNMAGQAAWSLGGKSMRRRQVEQAFAKKIAKGVTNPTSKASPGSTPKVVAATISRGVVSMINRGSDVEAEIQAQIDLWKETINDNNVFLADAVHLLGNDSDPANHLTASINKAEMRKSLWQNALKAYKGIKYEGKAGFVYQVEVPDNKHLLRYHLALSEQSSEVTEILEREFPDLFAFTNNKIRAHAMTGEELYRYIGDEVATGDPPVRPLLARLFPGFAGAVNMLSSAERASLHLRDLGIPGHEFRGTSSGELNYVIYDDGQITITEQEGRALFSRKGIGTEETNIDMFATPEEAESMRRKEAMQEEIAKRDAKRNTGQEDTETGDGGDLFSEARNQGELFSRAINADPEIEAMITGPNAVMATPLEDITAKDRIRSAVQRIKAIEWLNIKQGLIDSAASVENLEKMINDGVLMDASESAYKAMLATKNLGSVMSAVMHVGIPVKTNGVFSPRAGRKGLIEIVEPVVHHKDGNLLAQWELYVAAYRAKRLITERNYDGSSKEKNFSQAQINKALTLATQYPEFEVARKGWQKFNEQLLDLTIKEGVINGEEAKVWRQNDYVPFYRAMEEVEYEGGQGPKAGHGIANVRSGIKRLTGSETAIGNVFENMVMNTSYLVDAVFRNHAMQRVVAMAEGISMERIPMAWETFKIRDGDMARALMKAGLIVGEGTTEADMFNDGIRQVKAMSTEQKNHWSRVFRKVAPKGDDIVSVLVEGKPVYYRVDDPALIRSISAMGAQQFGGVVGLFRMAKRTLTGAVTIDPAFMMANFIRDTLSTWVVADHGKAPPFLKALKGAKSAWVQDEDTMQLMMAGAGGGGFYDHNPTDVRKMLLKKMPAGQVNSFTNSILTPRGLWRFWQKVGNASEQANRVAKYRQVIADGGTIAEAAYQARDVLNFSMSGDYEAMKFIVQSVPFLNARIQGLYRLARGAQENPVGFAMKGLMITAATIALLLRNEDNDDYDQLPEWDKDTYWHFFIGDEHFRLPKPFEVGALFATIPERAMRLGSGDEDLDLFYDRMKHMIAETFAFNPVPQLIKPLSEQWGNRNWFTGNPIIGLAHEGLQPEAQYDPWTSSTMRALAASMPDSAPEWLRSPKRLEAATRGYFGAIGMYALGAADSITRRAMGHPSPPAKALQDYPVITRFWRNPEPRSSKYSSQLYDMMHASDAIYKTMNAYRDQGRIKEYQDLRQDGQGKLQTRKRLHAVAGRIRKINKQIRRVQYSTISPEEKRAAIDRLNQQKLRVLSEVAAVSDIF